MLYDFTPITYDCKIYMNHMKQKSVDVDMTAATKADVKAIYLRSYGGSVDFHFWKDTPIQDFHREFSRLKDT